MERTAKEQIIQIFRDKVKGKKPDVHNSNPRHDGKRGNWLERQFGVTANGRNAPDILGYELKCDTVSKTTFGDWSANEYIYNRTDLSNVFLGLNKLQKRDSFLKIFGKNHINNPERYSWSGEPCPRIDCYNSFGQILEITPTKDIIALYSFSKDERKKKAVIVPVELQREDILLARWYGLCSPTIRQKTLKKKFEDKFNCNGWFTCKTDIEGFYNKICFGNPLNYGDFLMLLKNGSAFFDSGMYTGNGRPYSQWRMKNQAWDNLIIETYE